MKKAILLFISFQMALAQVSPNETLMTTLKNSTLLRYSEKPFAELWKGVRPIVDGNNQVLVDNFLRNHKNVLMPEISVVELKRSQSVSEGIRIIVKQKGMAINIEIINDEKIAAFVNGIAFTHQDVSSFDSIMKKLIAEFYTKKNKKVVETEVNFFKAWAFLLVGFQAEASIEGCVFDQGKICWDSIDRASQDDAVVKLKQMISSKGISEDELRTYRKEIERKRAECQQGNQDSQCDKVERRARTLAFAMGPGPKDKAPPSRQERGEGIAVREKSSSGGFWSDDSSWNQTALIAAGVAIATIFGCRSGLLKFLGCGKSGSSGGSGSTTLSSSLPGDTPPTSEVNTGTGVK